MIGFVFGIRSIYVRHVRVYKAKIRATLLHLHSPRQNTIIPPLFHPYPSTYVAPSISTPPAKTQLYLPPHHPSSNHLRRPLQPRPPIRIPPNLHILLLSLLLRLRLRSLTSFKALLEISNDIINVFGADGDADEIFGDAGVDALGFGKLFVRCGPGVDGQGFGVADTGKGEEG